MEPGENHYQRFRLPGRRRDQIGFFCLMSVLLVFPFLASNYLIYVATFIALNVLVAIGLDLLMGQAGQVSLGHGGFVAIGAYAVVLLMTGTGLPFFLAIPLAGLVSAGFGLLLALPALRLKGPYLAIASLAFGLAVIQIIGRWSFFGGHMGLQAPALSLGPIKIEGDRALYALTLPIVVVMAMMARNLRHTRIGRAFSAIRESEIAAATMGIEVARYKTMAFGLSAFYAGIAGALWAFVLGYINPGMFDFFLSILFMAMVVVGGVGQQGGVISGAILVTGLNLELGNLEQLPGFGPVLIYISKHWMSMEGLASLRYVVFGCCLMAVVMFEPQGLYGSWLRLKNLVWGRLLKPRGDL